MTQPISGGLIVAASQGAINNPNLADVMNILLVGNDHLILLLALQDSETDEFVNTAIVTAQIKTEDGENVGDEIELEYIADSDGNYRGLIQENVPILDDTYYIVELRASTLAGDVAFWRFKRMAQYRQP